MFHGLLGCAHVFEHLLLCPFQRIGCGGNIVFVCIDREVFPRPEKKE